MKTIDPKATTTMRLVCPLCSYGCEFGVVSNDFGIKGVEYLPDGCTGGRLCPRGSAAAMYLDHPGRLTIPVGNGRPIEWAKVKSELSKAISDPNAVAVTFDRNVTVEEHESIMGFCQSASIKHVASTYLEPEFYLSDFLAQGLSEKDIESAQSIVVLGDPFNLAPVSSKALINWRLGSRERKLYVIDSIRTHTAAYAHDFLKVNVGTEPLLLFALAQHDLSGIDVPAVTGIDGARIRAAAESFRGAGKGLIIACLPFAHTYDPILLAEGLRMLSERSKKRVMPYVEFAGLRGTEGLAAVLDGVKTRAIKHLINFGEMFPFYYRPLLTALKGANIYAASTLKYDDCTVWPAALNLEKKGTISTTFGPKKLTGNVNPASGTKTVHEILSMFGKEAAKYRPAKVVSAKVDIGARLDRLADRNAKPKKDHFTLIGEKIAFYYLTFLDKEVLKMNPSDADTLGLRHGDMATVTSKRGDHSLKVAVTTDVDAGIVAVPAESPEVRGLFDFVIEGDGQGINFVPTEVKICRNE